MGTYIYPGEHMTAERRQIEFSASKTQTIRTNQLDLANASNYLCVGKIRLKCLFV